MLVVVIAVSLHPNWVWTLVLTPIVVLFTSSGIADVVITDAARLGFTLIGGALVLLATAIAQAWAATETASARSVGPCAHRCERTLNGRVT